jgi:urease beta subunit
MRRERSFLILLVIGIAFGAYVYFVERKRPAGDEPEKKPKVFENVQESEIEEMLVTSGGSTTRLKKIGGKWQIVEPISSDADMEQVNNLLGNFATLERDEVVDETPSDVKRFGLSPARADVAFRKQGSKEMRHLLVGNKAPTAGEIYAQVQGEKRVILISGFMESVFVRSTFDLRDKTVLKFDRDKADALELQPATGGAVRLSRGANEWRIAAPLQVRADFGTAEAIVGHLATAQMRSLVSSDASTADALKQYGLDRPAITATVGSGSARASLQIGAAAKEGTFYARDTSRPLVFTVDSSLVDDLKKPAPDFRRKDVFDFRPFNATHLEIAQGGTTYTFDKEKKTDPKSPTTDVWRQKSPARREIDIQKMDSFLSGFSNLRAESWAEAGAAGSSALSFAVTFDDGRKQERVSFARQGADVFATRADEPGAAKVSATDYETAARALDAVIK